MNLIRKDPEKLGAAADSNPYYLKEYTAPAPYDAREARSEQGPVYAWLFYRPGIHRLRL